MVNLQTHFIRDIDTSTQHCMPGPNGNGTLLRALVYGGDGTLKAWQVDEIFLDL